MKYDPNKKIKTEDFPAVKTESGTSAHPNEDLSAAQEQMSLVKTLISKTVKLKAEMFEQDASLAQLRREMAEMKNTMEAETQSLQARLDKHGEENEELKQKLTLQAERAEAEKRLPQTGFSQSVAVALNQLSPLQPKSGISSVEYQKQMQQNKLGS